MKLYRVMVDYAKGQAKGSMLGDFTDRATAALHARKAALTLFAPEPSAGRIVEVEGFGCGRGEECEAPESSQVAAECGGKVTYTWHDWPYTGENAIDITSVALKQWFLCPIESPPERVCLLGGSKGEAGACCQA